MKKTIFLAFFLFFSFALFGQLIIGGGAVTFVDADPNTIASIATQTQAGAKKAINTQTGWEYLYDDTRAAGARWVLCKKVYNETRTVPLVANDIVQIGNFGITNAGANLKIDIVYHGAGFGRTKSYNLAINNTLLTAAWHIVQPVNQTLIEAVPAFQVNLLIRQNNATSYDLVLQRTAGAAATTAYITIEIQHIAQGITFSASTATSTIAAAVRQFTNTGFIPPNVHTFSASFTASLEQEVFVCKPTAAMILTLPLATNVANKRYKIINHGTVAITLSQSVRLGNATVTSTVSAGSRMTIISDGTEWLITE